MLSFFESFEILCFKITKTQKWCFTAASTLQSADSLPSYRHAWLRPCAFSPYSRFIITRWAKCFVLLLLSCLGLSALYCTVLTKLPTPDPARRPGIAPPRVRYTVSISLFGQCYITLRQWREGSSSHFLSTVCTVCMINLCFSLLRKSP